jgi:hypothetical protein
LSFPMMVAGRRQALMASRKKAVLVPTFPLGSDWSWLSPASTSASR